MGSVIIKHLIGGFYDFFNCLNHIAMLYGQTYYCAKCGFEQGRVGWSDEASYATEEAWEEGKSHEFDVSQDYFVEFFHRSLPDKMVANLIWLAASELSEYTDHIISIDSGIIDDISEIYATSFTSSRVGRSRLKYRCTDIY